MHPPPLHSTHFHPAPSTSIQLIPASTQLSATPSTLLQPKYCIQLGNFAKFMPKIQSCPFWLKIGSYGISRMLILFPILVFWISNPQSISGQIWAKKIKVCRKIGTNGIVRILILILILVFWISNPKSVFGQI